MIVALGVVLGLCTGVFLAAVTECLELFLKGYWSVIKMVVEDEMFS